MYPSTDMSSFIDHIDLTLQKDQKENKTVFMMGDSNINHLKYQSHPETNDFINLMVPIIFFPISCIQQGLQTILLQ